VKSEDILRYVDTISRDKQIDKSLIFDGIEQAILQAAQKKYGTAEGVEVTINRETGEIDARLDGEPFNPEDLGRISAGSGKQVLYQKNREAEREVIEREYAPRIGEMLNGKVLSRKGGGLVVELGQKAEGFMPRGEQSFAEDFREGDRIRVILKEVNMQPNRVQLLVSRAAPELVKRLFEQEIPEVADFVVEVKAIAREAGFRTKIAVATLDQNVDCVGACVGVKGSRIRNIVDELHGEKIDIVRWNDSPEIMIVEALKPAEIASLELDYAENKAVVYVHPEQQSLAIGRKGQNVRLASKLTGWDLDITPISEEDLATLRSEALTRQANDLFGEKVAALGSTPEETAPTASSSALDALFAGGGEAPPSGAEAVPEELEYDEEALVIGLEDLPGVTPEVADRLVEAGLDQTEAMLEAGVEGLARIEGLDEEMARQILVILEGGEI
jgi:N utilization substance protein A